jgi:hypothetical protein
VLPVGENLALIRDRLMLELAEDTVVRLQDYSFLVARGYGAADTPRGGEPTLRARGIDGRPRNSRASSRFLGSRRSSITMDHVGPRPWLETQ